jgi:hypothetical protein
MRGQRIVRPLPGSLLREGIKATLDGIGVDRPSPLGGNCIGDRIEVTRWLPIFGLHNLGQGETEIAAQPFLQGLIGGDAVVAKFQIEGRALGIANQGDREQDQRRVAWQVGFFVLVPAQETKGDKEDVDAALLLGGLRVARRMASSRLCKSPGGRDVCKPFGSLVLGVARRGVVGAAASRWRSAISSAARTGSALFSRTRFAKTSFDALPVMVSARDRLAPRGA